MKFGWWVVNASHPYLTLNSKLHTPPSTRLTHLPSPLAFALLEVKVAVLVFLAVERFARVVFEFNLGPVDGREQLRGRRIFGHGRFSIGIRRQQAGRWYALDILPVVGEVLTDHLCTDIDLKRCDVRCAVRRGAK